MADTMDFVLAKSILDKFANVYRAAEFMADALDTAASLQRRAGELHNNVENLLKEQATQQQRLVDMQAEMAQKLVGLQQQQQVRIDQLRADQARVVAAQQAQKTRLEGEVAAAQKVWEDTVTRATARKVALDEEIATKEARVASLEQAVGALKKQVQQVLA